jgi:hypothetical protein
MHALGVLDDQQAQPAGAGLVGQKTLQQTAAVGLVVLREREAELTQDLEQELTRTDVLALNRGHIHALVQVLQQALDQQALAAAVIRDDHAETRLGPKRMPHELERTQVLVTGKEEGLVRGIGEGLGGESETGGNRQYGDVGCGHVAWRECP